ncbi:MAG TPA: hypothetical protein VIY08_11965 [Candidatus Nitrosocosmicus sp.]
MCFWSHKHGRQEEEEEEEEEEAQLFRHYDEFNGDTFLEFLKKIHANSKMLFVYG